MSDEPNMRTGSVAATPEGGPIDEGVPASSPGSGQVQITPEAGPLTPPTLRDHMQGPILGLDGVPETLPSPIAMGDSSPWQGETPLPAGRGLGEGHREGAGLGVRASVGEGPGVGANDSTRTAQDDTEFRKWPPYSGKPVSEVHWDDARRYAAPLVSQAEKLTIQALGFTGRGLSRLARLLEERRVARQSEQEDDDAGGDR